MRERLQVGTETRSTLQILTSFQALVRRYDYLQLMFEGVPPTCGALELVLSGAPLLVDSLALLLVLGVALLSLHSVTGTGSLGPQVRGAQILARLPSL